jgi:hypothetical protein
MKQGFVLFVATVVVLSTLRSANADPNYAVECFGDHPQNLLANRVYFCLLEKNAMGLYDHMAKDKDKRFSQDPTNTNDRSKSDPKWGEFKVIDAKLVGGILRCYRYEGYIDPKNSDPNTNKVAAKTACLYYRPPAIEPEPVKPVIEPEPAPGAFHR